VKTLTDEELIDEWKVATLRLVDRGLLDEGVEDTAEQLQRERRWCRGIVDQSGSCKACGLRLVEPLLGHEPGCWPRAIPAGWLLVRDVWRSLRWHAQWIGRKVNRS
jgi:hypothetical protein